MKIQLLEFIVRHKNDDVVKYTLPENSKNIVASQYKLYLPTEQKLLEKIRKEMENFTPDDQKKQELIFNLIKNIDLRNLFS